MDIGMYKDAMNNTKDEFIKLYSIVHANHLANKPQLKKELSEYYTEAHELDEWAYHIYRMGEEANK